MAGIKIVDLPALGRDLAATDLLELSLAGGTGSRKITGQEIINASKLNVGTTPIINGTAGRLLFQSTGNVLSQSSNLFWDATNNRLGIGTSTPTRRIDVLGSGDVLTGLKTTSATGAASHVVLNDVDSSFEFGMWGSTRTSYGAIFPNNAYIYGGVDFAITSLSNIKFGAGATPNERMRIVGGTGNVLINTTTDAGFKLDVNGTGRFQNTLKLSNNITASTQNGYFEGNTAGNITNTTAVFNFQYPTSATTGTMFQFSDNLNTGYISDLYGNKDILRVFGGFKNPNSSWVYSDIKIDPTYQGVGLGTIVRGIYYNPTNSLTGSYTLRAIETTTGDVIFNGGNVGIGTSSPAYNLDVNGTSRFKNNVDIVLRGADTSWDSRILNNYEWFFKAGNYTSYINFGWGSGSALRIQQNGNVLINTTTDAGFRLDVNGTSRLNGSLTLGNGLIFNLDGSTTRIFNSSQINYQSNLISGTQHNFTNQVGYNTGTIMSIYAGGSANPSTSGTMAIQSISGRMSFASGNATYNAVQVATNVENSGTYNGTIRGFYYNPSLLGTGYSHFAFHSTSGRVRFEGLPTSPTGLNAGDLWNDAGTLKIV